MSASAKLLNSLATGVLLDDSGNVLVNRQVYVYKRNTFTQVNVYQDSGLTSLLIQPLTTDNNGSIPGYIAGGVSIDFVDVITSFRTQAEPIVTNDIIGTDGLIAGPGSVGLTSGYPTSSQVIGSDNKVGGSGSLGLPAAVVQISGAPSESGSTGDVFAVKSDGNVHRYSPMGISAATYGMVGDAVTRSFTSVSGTTMNTTAPFTNADAGKLICIPGAGAADSTGVKDGFTTTIQSVQAGVSVTLTDSVTTNIGAGSWVCSVGTDNTTALSNFVTAVAGKRGYIPAGNYAYTAAPNLATPITSPASTPPRNSGIWIEGAGTGTNNTVAQSATCLWFMGPTNASQGAGVNGAGAPAFWAASSNDVYGVKLRGFGINCLRNLCVGTTVSGAGQVINASSSLTVASTAGMASFGRVFITGVGECQYTGLSGGNTITGLQPDTAGSTATNGGAVFTQVAALYQDRCQQSEVEDISIAGYQDNNASDLSALGGITYWHNGPTVGNTIINRVYGRYFGGPNTEGLRLSAVNTGYGVAGNAGNMIINSTAFTQVGKYGYHFYITSSGPLDGITLNSPKAITRAPGVSYYFHGQGVVGVTINGPHSEGCANAGSAFLFAGAQGNKVNGGFASCVGGTVGDNSTFVSFTGTANHNVFQGEWVGNASPSSSGTFDYVCSFGSSTYGNRVETSSTPTTSPYPGTAQLQPLTGATASNSFRDFSPNAAVSYGGTTQNFAPIQGGDASTGQQAGIIAPDARSIRGQSAFTNIANQANFGRFVLSRPLYVTKISFVITSPAGTTTDAVDVGIYQALTPGSGNLTKILTSGTTGGQVTAGLKTITFGTPVTLVPGAIYYAAFAYGSAATTAAAIQALNFGTANIAGLFGVTAGTNESGIQSSAFPLPSTTSGITWSQATCPLLAVRES